MRSHVEIRDAAVACVERHHSTLFAGMPRSIATRQAVVNHEREQNRIEDALDEIERIISKGRTTR